MKTLLMRSKVSFFVYSKWIFALQWLAKMRAGVLSAYQGKEMGAQILRDALEVNQGKRIFLKSYQKNPARRLYQRRGFRKDGETATHC